MDTEILQLYSLFTSFRMFTSDKQMNTRSEKLDSSQREILKGLLKLSSFYLKHIKLSVSYYSLGALLKGPTATTW